MLRLTRTRVLALACSAIVGVVGLLGNRAARADDGAAARALVGELAADTAHAVVIAEPLTRAREAVERATRLRESGDEARAKAAEGLALEWAETAKDLAGAADAERVAGDRRREAMAKRAQVERARALVEADLAHVGRLRKELDEATGAGRSRGADPDRAAVEVHDDDRLDARGKPKPAPKKSSKKPVSDAAEPGDKP